MCALAVFKSALCTLVVLKTLDNSNKTGLLEGTEDSGNLEYVPLYAWILYLMSAQISPRN